jgi:hypothetical protein
MSPGAAPIVRANRVEKRLDRHGEQSEAIQTKPQLESPSLGRFALLAMTERA